MSGDQPVPSGADAQFAAWKQGIEERVRALETAPRTPHMSSRNGFIQFLNSVGETRIVVGDDPTLASESQRIAVLADGGGGTLGYVFFVGDQEVGLGTDPTDFIAQTGIFVVNDNNQADHIFFIRNSASPTEQEKLGMVLPVCSFQLADVRNGNQQAFPVTSATFQDCWQSDMPAVCADKLQATFGLSTDVGTTGEYRGRLICGAGTFYTDTKSLASGANDIGVLNWSWMPTAGVWGSEYNVLFTLQTRRTGGAGNVYCRPSTGLSVVSSTLGAGASGGWV